MVHMLSHSEQEKVRQEAILVEMHSFIHLEYNRSPQPSTNVSSFCLKVMVVSIILYDHIDSHGAFTKSSPINVRDQLFVQKT